MRRRSVAVAWLVLLVAAVPVLATSAAPRPTFMTPFDPQGSFEVQALVNGFWQPVGELTYDRYIRERALALPAAAVAAPHVRIRLVQHGGGAAQIDRVVLGEVPPVGVVGVAESDAVALAARRDNDVLDAFGRTIELAFPGRTAETVLRLAARVEPKVNEGAPFAFPPANLYTTLTPDSAFYRYRPTAAGHAPSWPDALDTSHALFAELCRPTSGHPDGVTYGWVANDRDTLYAEVEFTSDNTCDGNKDFSSVTVEHNGRLKEFRVSQDQTRWGHPSFLATNRASYHHKLYTFAIPFSEIGIRNAKEAGELKLAFAAYGTSATFFVAPGSHNFGTIEVGTTSPQFIETVVNNFPFQVTLDTPYITRGGPDTSRFPLTDLTCHDGLALPSNTTCTFEIAFAPTAVGGASDAVSVKAHTAAGGPLTWNLTVQGNGAIPIPTVSLTGLALLVLALCVLGYFILRRR